MPSDVVKEKRVDASAEGGLTEIGEGRLERIGFLVFVESIEIELTKPVEVYLQFEEGHNHWVASFCPAAISAAGDTTRQAIEELRRLLPYIYETWTTGKDLPDPWKWLSPKHLEVLEGHFARKSIDA
jgi:hypothetical protein